MDSTPWAASRSSFVGWIPNVGSHLSFSRIGVERGRGVRRFTQAYDGHVGRLVCLLQRRTTDDFLVPPALVRPSRRDIVQHWLMLGSTRRVRSANGLVLQPGETSPGFEDQQGMLEGTIHMLPRHREERSRRLQEWTVGELVELISSTQGRATWAGNLSDRELDAFAAEVGRIVRWHAPASLPVRFALMRSGEMRLWFEEEVALLHDRNVLTTTARQAYYFAKDMVHRHTHHEPSSDQMTPLVAVNAAKESRRRDGEEGWRRETVWSLSRAVEELQASGRLDDKREALGIIAYADAFQSTLLTHRRDERDPAVFVGTDPSHAYDYGHTRESIKVTIEREQARRSHLTAMYLAALASCIAAESLLSSLTSTTNAALYDARVPERFQRIETGIPAPLVRHVAGHPLEMIAVVFLLVALISSLVTDDGARLLNRSTRRMAQAARGVSISVALRLGRSSRSAHRLLVACYLIAIALPVAGLFHVGRIVRALMSPFAP